MAYIKEYWAEKENRAKLARKHTKDLDDRFSRQIKASALATRVYTAYDFENVELEEDKDEDNTEIIVEDIDSVSAVMKYGDSICRTSNLAVLNFSSYKNPGGMFIAGSKAQEECLCHASFLYNVLREFQLEFYDWNNRHKNKALYLNRGLFSEGVWFFNETDHVDCSEITRAFPKEPDHVECSVITCAAPNKSAAQRYQNVSDEENTKVLRSRIKFVLDMATVNEVDTLILGAYGCGVFGQDPTEVAGIFKEYLTTTHKGCFNRVVFAIPNGRNNNLQAFEKVFCS